MFIINIQNTLLLKNLKGKLIHHNSSYYLDVFKNVKFYVSPYNVDPKTVNRNAELSTGNNIFFKLEKDALSEIVDK